MNRYLHCAAKRLAVLGLSLVALASANQAYAQSASSPRYETEGFQATYNYGGTEYRIQGIKPTTPGKYPVYVHIGGTGESFQSAWAGVAVSAAAQRGLIAVSVEYPNSSFGNCDVIADRAKGIFDSSNADSAISRVCALSNSDCSKGVVTGGLSQGSIISVLSRNFDSRVRASFGQGTGYTYTSYYNLSACIADGNHAQKGTNLRVINGEHDMFVGGTQAVAASQAATVTGLTCSSNSQSCFRSNGSGWYVVKDAEVRDNYADHCFMGYGGYPGTQCEGPYVDSNYANGNTGWELNPTMDWLVSYINKNGSAKTASN